MYGNLRNRLLKAGSKASVLLNMGINGIFAMLLVLIVGGDLNGPTIGGIFTIVAFPLPEAPF